MSTEVELDLGTGASRVSLGSEELEEVTYFMHLESLVSVDDVMEVELIRWLEERAKIVGGLVYLWRNGRSEIWNVRKQSTEIQLER